MHSQLLDKPVQEKSWLLRNADHHNNAQWVQGLLKSRFCSFYWVPLFSNFVNVFFLYYGEWMHSQLLSKPVQENHDHLGMLIITTMHSEYRGYQNQDFVLFSNFATFFTHYCNPDIGSGCTHSFLTNLCKKNLLSLQNLVTTTCDIEIDRLFVSHGLSRHYYWITVSFTSELAQACFSRALKLGSNGQRIVDSFYL